MNDYSSEEVDRAWDIFREACTFCFGGTRPDWADSALLFLRNRAAALRHEEECEARKLAERAKTIRDLTMSIFMFAAGATYSDIERAAEYLIDNGWVQS